MKNVSEQLQEEAPLMRNHGTNLPLYAKTLMQGHTGIAGDGRVSGRTRRVVWADGEYGKGCDTETS